MVGFRWKKASLGVRSLWFTGFCHCFLTTIHTGCLNMNCQTSTHLFGIKNTLLSHENNICTFMRCGNLTYDTYIWLKITSLSSTASVLNYGRISLELPSFCSEICFFQNIKIRWFQPLAYWYQGPKWFWNPQWPEWPQQTWWHHWPQWPQQPLWPQKIKSCLYFDYWLIFLP